jgi:predicted nucleic acid-binding protein
MPADPAFFDSNIICYLFGADPAKADRAELLLAGGGWISVQVLGEVTHVARRKAGLDWAQVTAITETMSQLCDVASVTLPIHREARRLAEDYGFAFYDAQIVATALAQNCAVLWSEDMQDGRSVSSQDGRTVTIRNPFSQTAPLPPKAK